MMMINILLCGNKKVFDGTLTELISITNRTKCSVQCDWDNWQNACFKEKYWRF